MPHNSHNTQNAGATVGMSNGVLSTNGNAGIAGTTTTAGSSSPGDDLGSTDEVKVFKDEGEQDEEISSQNLLEEKSSLIDLTESEVSFSLTSQSTCDATPPNHCRMFARWSNIIPDRFYSTGKKREITVETGARISFW